MIWRAIICFNVTATLCAQDRVGALAGQTLISGFANGASGVALFNDPASIVADQAGYIFVADSANHVIRKVSTNGVVSTVASGFSSPSGIAVSLNGTLFVADTGNGSIRKIAQGGIVSTVATGFDSPLGIAVAPNGILYVADSGNHVVRVISTDGVVSVIAGSIGDWGISDGKGTEARFNCPLGLALDRDGNLFVSDSNNHTIRRIAADRTVKTIAGSPLRDGFVDGNDARFSNPAELRFDGQWNLFVADSSNNAIRKISPDGRVTTVTGFSGAAGSVNGINGRATFYNPYSLAFLPDGRVAISDAYNQLIRQATMPIEMKLEGGAVSWNSVARARYQVQFSDDLFSWIDAGEVIAAGPVSTFSDPLNSSVRIYRIKQEDAAP